MKAIDWSVLSRNVIIFMIILVLSLGLYYGVQSYNQKIAEDFNNAEKSFNIAQNKYRQAEKNRTLYKQYLSDYRKYINKGLVGEEKRLSWVEELEAINKSMALPKLSYSINPREEATLKHIKSRNKKIKINVSEMQIQAGFLHEGDFLTVLNRLNEKAAGFYSLKSCKLNSRFNKKIKQFSPRNSYININCELDWLTVKIEG